MDPSQKTLEPAFVSAVRKGYMDCDEIYLVESIDQLKERAEQVGLLPETIKPLGEWYEVLPTLEHSEVSMVALALQIGLDKPCRVAIRRTGAEKHAGVR